MKFKIFELRKKGYTYQQIANELGISKGTISYHCKPYNVDKKIANDIIAQMQPLYDELKSCAKVAKQLNISKSTVLKHVTTNEPLGEAVRKKKSVKLVVAFRKRKKQELIEYKGGECSACGYKKSIWALQFHHIDPTQKDFTITAKSWALERLKKEADKCTLLCANCHAEEHERIYNMKIIEKRDEINAFLKRP